jgi:thiamine-phosphate pyrophosphorylase
MTQLNLARVLRLMLVTDDRLVGDSDLVEVCRAAERGGVTAVQLRLKEASPGYLIEQLRRLKAALGVPVLVNDRLDVALAGGADGVHLGPDDVAVAMARTLVPPGFVIGASVGTEAELDSGQEADYWGVGPFRATQTKGDAGDPLGPEGLHQLVRRAAGRPCIAIGGILPEDVGPIRQRGAVGVAVVSGILGEADIEAAARRYALPLHS